VTLRRRQGEQILDRPGELGRAPRGHQPPPGGLDHLRQPDRVAADHRDLHRQGLLDHHRHRVAVAVGGDHAGHRQQVGMLEQLANAGRPDGAGEAHPAADPKFGRAALELLAQRPVADDRQLHGLALGEQARGLDQVAKALLLDQASDREHRASLGERAVTAKPLRVDPHHDHLDPSARRGDKPAQVAGRVLARGDGEGRGTELSSEAPRRAEDVVAVRDDADRHPGEGADAQGVGGREPGEVHVHMALLAALEPPRRRRQGGQRQPFDRLIDTPRPQIGGAAQRMTGEQGRQGGDPIEASLVLQVTRGHLRRDPGHGIRWSPQRLDPDRPAQLQQPLRLVGDEGLRDRGELVGRDHQPAPVLPHGRPGQVRGGIAIEVSEPVGEQHQGVDRTQPGALEAAQGEVRHRSRQRPGHGRDRVRRRR